MENSKAYKYLIEQINAEGFQKLDGYKPNIMEEIYDWERDEVESIIWNTFNKNNDKCISPVAVLVSLTPSDAVYNLLKNLYINSNNETIRSTAADGLLHCKGYIKDVNDIDEIMKNLSLSKKFMLKSIKRRKNIVIALEKKEL